MKKLLSILCVLLGFIVSGQTIEPKPNPPRLVNDFANVLTASEAQQLEATLVEFDNQTSSQIAVIIVPSINDYPLESVTLKYLRDWGIGNAKSNNGVLLFVAIKEHKVRIETGYGMEGALPDITCRAIIDNDMAPRFKQNDYSGGITAAVNSITKATKGEYTAPAGYTKKKGKSSGWIFPVLIIIIVVISFLSKGGGGGNMMSRRGSSGLGSALFWTMLGNGLGGRSGGGSGGGFGGGGGGFGGFGGGSGGGGGASGGW